MSALRPGTTVLLFFRDFERDRFVKYDRYAQRLARPLYRRLAGKPRVSGFFMWYQLLTAALVDSGFDVRHNDYRLARQHPSYPVGLVGYPELLHGWSLPNPAVLGPALYDHPAQAPTLMDDPRFRSYLVTCDWMYDLFEPVYGDRVATWHAGMVTDDWVDTSTLPKDIDILVYDKVRWNRDRFGPELIEPIQREFARRSLRVETIRYGAYTHEQYQRLLARSKGMLFLCEHETQGMAYQEAMASNVPVLAWDQGYWLDPRRPEYTDQPVRATSVPYFSETCGERFAGIEDFAGALERFLARQAEYRPRDYVREHLSLRGSAARYLAEYAALLPREQPR